MPKNIRRAGLVLFALTFTALFAMAQATVAAARPWLGVVTQEITGELREGMDLPDGAGVLVNRVVDDGPAARAGVRQGDVIVRFNSRAVGSPQDLARMVGEARERQDVAVQVLRHGERQTLTVTLASRSDDDDSPSSPPEPGSAPDAPPAPGMHDDHGDHESPGRHDVRVKVFRNGDKPESYRVDDLDQLPGHVREMMRDVPGLDGNGGLHTLRLMGAGRGRLGVRIESLNADLAGALGAPGTDGVLVLEVIKDTPAERAGLRAGDVILTVEGRDVKNAEGLVESLRDVNGKVSLTVSRQGSRRTVEAELAAAPRMNRGEGPMMGHGRMGEPDRGSRLRDRDDTDNGDLRQQMDELRQQLRELRQQLEERRHE